MSENTVFVIGAGASEEAKLPTGDELKIRIAKLLDIRFDTWGEKLEHGDRLILEALKLHARQRNVRSLTKYLHAAHHIRDALPMAISIDNFIDAHRENDKIALCGKLAIVRSILDAEKRSLLYFEESKIESNIGFSSLKSTWYISFFKLLTENCRKNDLQERFESITLTIFNYDRCIEHFIYYALQKYYEFSKTEAAELLKSINIYHPYGDVGRLNSGVVRFGIVPSSEQLLGLSQKIKTFTEGTDPDSSEILEIRNHMGMANRVVFLGFAFHKLNMQLITPVTNDDKVKSDVKCFATTFKVSDNDKEIVERQIKDLYHGNVRVSMANKKCSDFFNEFWRSLSF
jgi:hypothetical protein